MTITTLAIRCSIAWLALVIAAPAYAVCRDVTVAAKGTQRTQIEEAQASAAAAMTAKIKDRYGANWGAGSHRNGSFHCDRVLGYRGGWTCSAKTTVICSR